MLSTAGMCIYRISLSAPGFECWSLILTVYCCQRQVCVLTVYCCQRQACVLTMYRCLIQVSSAGVEGCSAVCIVTPTSTTAPSITASTPRNRLEKTTPSLSERRYRKYRLFDITALMTWTQVGINMRNWKYSFKKIEFFILKWKNILGKNDVKCRFIIFCDYLRFIFH